MKFRGLKYSPLSRLIRNDLRCEKLMASSFTNLTFDAAEPSGLSVTLMVEAAGVEPTSWQIYSTKSAT
jgi:hypothetical protein